MYSLPGQELTPFGIMLGDHLPSLPNCKKFPRQKYLNYSLFKSLQAFQEAHQATDWTVEGILPSPTSEPPLVSARRVSLDIEDPCPDLGIYLIGPYLQVFSYSQHSNWSQISWWITRKEREREREIRGLQFYVCLTNGEPFCQGQGPCVISSNYLACLY